MDDEYQESQQSEPQSDLDLVPDKPDLAPDESGEPDALYRQRAYEQRGRVAPIDGLLRVSLPHEWLLLGVLAAVVIGVLVWSFVGRLESGVSGPCALHASGVRHPVAAPVAGVVVEVLAEPADEVAAGDPLARLAAPELSLASELAAARAAALEAQHPGAPETVAAAAEAEALADIDMAGTLVLSPATGLLAASELLAGASVEAGAVVAEVQHVDAGPPSVVVSLGSESPRVRPGMKTSIALTIAGASHPVVADGFVAAVGAEAEAELVAPPPEFAAAPALPPSAYECSARIVTGSYRPIDRLLGRS
ncbi:MAG: biotin/lipoyl-binding protein [bacterium]|nr:biotin/lipoyl-binding protein [bacterium]